MDSGGQRGGGGEREREGRMQIGRQKKKKIFFLIGKKRKVERIGVRVGTAVPCDVEGKEEKVRE